MNRKELRAFQAQARKRFPIIAVHEAGHAVAAVMTARAMGWTPEEMLDGIDIVRPDRDGIEKGCREGITWRQLFSREMMQHLKNFIGDDTPLSRSELVPQFAAMRAAGIDLDGWYRARLLFHVFGPAAEAKYLGKSFDEVFNSDIAGDDWHNLVADAKLCGMDEQQIATELDAAIAIAEPKINQPDVWNAVTAVAHRLKYGRNEGKIISRLIQKSLALPLEEERARREIYDDAVI